MEETDGQRAEAIASNPPIREDHQASKAKEEGELTPSDDGENGICSTGQFTGTAATPSMPISLPQAIKDAQGIQEGKVVSGNNLKSTINNQQQASSQSKHKKSIGSNRVTLKSANPRWYAPSGGSNNLVIRFSDDSGSDSEEHREEKTVENKSNLTGVKPAVSSVEKLKKLGHNTRNVNKVMPKQLPLNRTGGSSMTKTFGGANSRGVGPSSMSKGSRVKYFNTQRKSSASHEHGNNQAVSLNSSKLRDLRQQIALRESELKLKSAQNKEMILAAVRDSNPMDLCNKKWILASADGNLSEPKEPDNKRLKVGESDFIHINLDGQGEIPAVKILLSKEPELKKSSVQDRNEVEQRQKIISMSTPESSIVRQHKHDDRVVDILSQNIYDTTKDGTNIHSNSQSERNGRLVDSCALSNETAKLAKITPSNLSMNLNDQELNHPSKVGRNNPPRSLLNKATSEQNLLNGSNCHKVMYGDKMPEPSFKDKRQTSPKNVSIWNGLGIINDLQHGNLDMQTLIELEDKLDKELEEVQEHRRRCEIEERNALKAYRKSQRALIEANARCTELYRQRELCAARFRSFIVDEPNLLWSSGRHESAGIILDTSNNVPENMDLIPASNQHFQHDYHGFNQPALNPNPRCINLVPHNLSYQHENGLNLGSEPCSEPDDSMSEPLPHNSNNTISGIRSPCSDPIVSIDEDEETSLMDHDSIQPSFEYQHKNRNSEVIQKGTDDKSNKNCHVDASQDSLLLEATLRSELVARLRKRTLSKNLSTSYNVEPVVDRGAESDVGSEKTQMSNDSVTLPVAGKKIQCDDGGEGPKRVTSESPIQNEEECHTGKTVSKFLSTFDSEDNGSSIGCHFLISKIYTPPFLLRSTFGHMKVMFNVTSTDLWTRHEQNHTYNFDSEEGAVVKFDKIEQSVQKGDLVKETPWGFSTKGMGFYTCGLAVDPSWPLCMYELRGKCNNDECPFQHLKDFSDRNMIQHQHDTNGECQITLHQQQCDGARKPSHDVLPSPTYLVCLDVLEADQHSPESVLAWRSVDCWWKCFSICLALSSLLHKDVSGDESFLDGSDGRIQIHGSWSRQSSYFESRNGIVNKPNQALGTYIQSLETALLILNQEVSEVVGIKKALSLLSRALEADQTSEILWIVYLLICYSDMKLVGKDDMFSYAVKHNEESYGLWLLYINSRKKLDEQLVAYDAALSVLCHRASASDKDEMYASACILDLFLQMMNCFCMSGNVDKAIQRIYRLLPATTTNTDEPHSMMLTNILACLTISDRCIFWVSCVYLTIYRKLPEVIVEQFEYDKKLLPVDWPPVNLGHNEKQRLLKLVEAAVRSIELCFNDESFKSEIDLRSMQIFALNHIRCMMALDGEDCYWNLCEKYTKLYPSCLELVLMLARMQKNDSQNVGFVGFEKAVCNWPKEVPGIQCIWNQYAEYAFQNAEADFVKKLMARWYDLVWRVENPQNEIMDAASGSTSNQMDLMFGFLNLSLHKFLQNDVSEAQVAFDQALKAAGPGGFKHCIREHATFLLTNESLLKEDAPISQQLYILKVYLDTIRTFPISEPLSRKFINDIEKPRIRQLVGSMLCPVSYDFSLVNLVLEAWYGPSLLPPRITKAKDLVDFVEAILEIVPSNYKFVISLCKLLSRGYQYGCFASSNILFWASSTLMNAIYCAIPIPPEHVWVEAAGILGNILGTEARHERFYKKALSVYPFSVKLWQCYHNQSNTTNRTIVVKAARERGIVLD
ncbi:hypothetical protein SLE2022_109000 [Rubroshorea leprosula]